MKTYLLLRWQKNLGAAKRKLNQFERLFTVGEDPLAKRDGDITTNYRTQANGCSLRGLG